MYSSNVIYSFLVYILTCGGLPHHGGGVTPSGRKRPRTCTAGCVSLYSLASLARSKLKVPPPTPLTQRGLGGPNPYGRGCDLTPESGGSSRTKGGGLRLDSPSIILLRFRTYIKVLMSFGQGTDQRIRGRPRTFGWLEQPPIQCSRRRRRPGGRRHRHYRSHRLACPSTTT